LYLIRNVPGLIPCSSREAMYFALVPKAVILFHRKTKKQRKKKELLFAKRERKEKNKFTQAHPLAAKGQEDQV